MEEGSAAEPVEAPSRQPVELADGKFARQVIQDVIARTSEAPEVKLVLGSYLDGAGLEGAWKLSVQIQAVLLVPDEEA